MKNRLTAGTIGLMLLCAAVMSACSAKAATPSDTSNNVSTTAEAVQSSTSAAVQPASVKTADLVAWEEEDAVTAWTAADSTAITLAGTNAVVDGAGATAQEGTVTITEAGTYVLNGTLSDGQIIVDEQAKVL